MRIKIKNLIAGRFIVLFVFSCLFAVVGFGQMGLFKTGELPYPSQKVIDVTKVLGPSQQFYEELNQLAEENHLTIYRSVVENGNSKGFVFGKFVKQENLTQNVEVLTQISPLGTYFVDGDLSKSVQKKISQLNVTFTTHPTGWQGVAGELLLGWSIRTKTFWMSLVLFSVTLLALKIARIRQIMVARTLGKMRLKVLYEVFSVILGLCTMGMILSILNHYIGTMLLPSFALVLGVICLLLCLAILLINLIFYIYIRLIPMIVILKNKQTGRFFSYVWLVVIVVSMSLMTIAVGTYQKTYQTLKNRQGALVKWQSLSNLGQLTIKVPQFMDESPITQEDRLAYDKRISDYDKKWRLFNQQFLENEKIFVEIPRELSFLNETGNGETTDALDFNQPTKVIQIQNKWIAKTWQVSPSLVKLSQKLFLDNPHIYQNKKSVTLYIPEKFRKDQADILPVVTSNFVNSGLTNDDFNIVFIPKKFRLFVSDITQLRDSEQPLTSVSDQIIAQYDYDSMPDTPAINSAVSATIIDTLYLLPKIPEAIQVSDLASDISNFSNTYKNLVNYQKQVQADITRSMIVMIGLLIMQSYVTYEFLKLRLSLVVKKMTLFILLGKNYIGLMVRVVLPLIFGIVVALSYAMFRVAHPSIVFGSAVLYLTLTTLLMFVVLQVMRRKCVTIIKGESDLM